MSAASSPRTFHTLRVEASVLPAASAGGQEETGGRAERHCAGPDLETLQPRRSCLPPPPAPPLGLVSFGGTALTNSGETVSPRPQVVSTVAVCQVRFTFVSGASCAQDG